MVMQSNKPLIYVFEIMPDSPHMGYTMSSPASVNILARAI